MTHFDGMRGALVCGMMQSVASTLGSLVLGAALCFPQLGSAMVPQTSLQHSFALPLIAEQDLPVRCSDAVRLLATLSSTQGKWRLKARCESIQGVGERMLRASLSSELKASSRGRFVPVELTSRASQADQARLVKILNLLQKFESPVVLQLSLRSSNLHAQGWIWVSRPPDG